MSDLTFIHNLPSEFSNDYLVPANSRYPVQWGYTQEKEVYHLIQLIGGGQYLFIATDKDYNYLGYSDSFDTANKLGQEYGQPKQVEQEKTADDLAWEEACRADDEAWQNGQAKLIEQIVEARDRASAEMQTEKVEQVAFPTVSNTVKGNIPSLFSNWVIIASTTYEAKYGDKYTILATKSKDSQNFLDIICDTNNNYIALGSERYSQTLEIAERMSLLAEADRLGF